MKSLGEGRNSTVWWFLGAAALVSILFYRDFIFHPERLIFGSDMLFEGISLRRFYVDEIQAGRGVPLWVPNVYAGMPFVGLLPGPIFYPSTILYFLMPLHRAIGWTFVLHTFLSGAFGYFLARSFRLRPSSAVVCGASFMLTGYMTSHLFGGHDGRMFAMALIPLALGLLNRGLETGEPRWFCGLALTIAAQVFTPHTQVMYFSSLALVLLFLFHLLFRIPRVEGKRELRSYVRPVTGFSLAVLASIALAGPQLFPVLALLPNVTRAAAETGYEFAASWALPPQELTALFLPDLVGSLGSYWGQYPFKLHTEFLGSVPLALAILGIAAGFGGALPREQRRTVGFLAVASLLGILFALGAATPVHRIAYTLLPLIGSLRAPAMMLGPVTVFVALLAAYGWEATLSGRTADTRVSWVPLALLGGPVVLLGAWAALDPEGLANFALLSWYPDGWPRRPDAALAPRLRTNGLLLMGGFALAWGVSRGVSSRRVAPWALVPVLAFGILDLWRVDVRYLDVQDAAVALAPDPVVSALQERARPGERVWAPDFGGPIRNYRPNELAYHGISSATGRQKFLLAPYATLVGGIRPDQGLRRDPVRAFLNVRYLITAGGQDGVESLAEASGRHLYPIPSLARYAFFPAEIEVAADASEAAARTWSNPEPERLAIVESRPGFEPPAAGRGTAAIVRYEPDLIEFDVFAASAGLLAVSEIHDPGWRAVVDGEETAIWRTNTAFRGVHVPAGQHRLTFEYRSPSFLLGVWTSLIALALMAVLLPRSRRSARTRRVDA
ncbi:YfhO family protein [Candidatus Palauibacter sp.]|uniref:YfhO family protein n=1 Tax=Candidatus Palauibacter sp. TaxID=3101350 RepID=UPI003AF2061E